MDIDDDGTVIATRFALDNVSYLWPWNGPVRQLTGPISGTTNVGVFAIRNGWVAGFDAYQHTVAWNLRTGATNVVDGYSGARYSLNRRGDLGLQGVIAQRDGRVMALPGLDGDSNTAPKVLADRGLAAGLSGGIDGFRAVIWTGC